MEIPDVQYARNGEVAIAYQVVGDGPTDIVFVRGFAGDLLSTWEQPLLLRHLLGVAEHGRVLMLDKRGQGLSDRMREVPTLETRMDDLRAVMDAAGAERALIWSAHEGARLATLFAAPYPERSAGLVLFDPEAKGTWSPDYPWARNEDEWKRWLAEVREGWGRREFFEQILREWAPNVAPARAIRCACSIRDGVAQLGIEIRAGLHTGECEVVGEKVAGVAVHTGARIVSLAGPGEVLVSQTVKDLVAGSGIAFEDRGAHELKGIPGEWRLYAVSAA